MSQMIECQVAENSRGQRLPLERNDHRQFRVDMPEHVAGVMMMSEDDDIQADQQHVPADPDMVEPGRAVLETP